MKITFKYNFINKGIFLLFIFGIILSFGYRVPENQTNKRVANDADQSSEFKVIPIPYERALRNPLKGFTTRGIYDHPWATTAQTYIQWNELENIESDGIEKIRQFCNQKWFGVEETFIEMGIFGKWGEHHSPAPTLEMQNFVGNAFAKAFKNKKVSVRHNWNEFQEHPFGEYWDSWAHYDQMWPHGNSIKKMNDQGRYLENYVGGEAAYDWGNGDIQPGPSPTASVAEEKHRNFVINTIRWLHCTQLRWIENYDQNNPEAVQGAEEIQKAFGYRFVLNEVRFSLSDSLTVEFDVTNTGSAPFYYDWPAEVSLLDKSSLKPVWKSTINHVDITNWLPGENWTDPDWTKVSGWSEQLPDSNWNASGKCDWEKPPQKNTVKGSFKINIPDGKYILALAILDPAGNLPSLRFATVNYLNGGRHPLGILDIEEKQGYPLPTDFPFHNPKLDNSLHYFK